MKIHIYEKLGMFLGYLLAGILGVGMAVAMIAALIFVTIPFAVLILYFCSFESIRILVPSC